MRIHHVGYLVDDIEISAAEFESLCFTRVGKVIEDSNRLINVLFLKNGEHMVELIQPLNDSSPYHGLRKKHRNSPYHLCIQTDDLQECIDKMKAHHGHILIQPPQPAPAIDGSPKVAFLLNRHIGMIEHMENQSE